MQRLVEPVVGDGRAIRLYINSGGSFTVGGFTADTGLTGRKIMVDTYGGLVPHGGGAFSGKDPSKVDRSGAYMARFAAKNIVANGLAKTCQVSVAYVIGKEEPLMLKAVAGDGKDLTSILKQHFDFRPRAIIERLDLRRPIYQDTASYGHFGRDQFPWEHIVLF
jgi:S-adenosylmethionine synthetase